MPNAKFNAKSFNPEAFGYMVNRVPNLKINSIKKSKALVGNPEIRSTFTSQNGTAYARIAMRGLLDGQAVNYDGETDITASSTKTFEQGVVVVGRAKSWTERDFSYDITGGVDFMENIAEQVAEVDGNITATTLNTATQKACGANKRKFALVFCHSAVATNLENLNLLTYLLYTDKEGLTRQIDIATWNGKMVIIDDDMPIIHTDAVYAKTSDVALDSDKTYYTKSGSTYTAVASPDVTDIGDYYEMTSEAYDQYVTYVLGEGAFNYEDVGAKVPYEMNRDPKTNGGEDTLYMRQRKVFAPVGISYEKASQSTNSPTDTELKNGANWAIVHSGESVAANRSYYNHKAIAIARIISKG